MRLPLDLHKHAQFVPLLFGSDSKTDLDFNLFGILAKQVIFPLLCHRESKDFALDTIGKIGKKNRECIESVDKNDSVISGLSYCVLLSDVTVRQMRVVGFTCGKRLGTTLALFNRSFRLHAPDSTASDRLRC